MSAPVQHQTFEVDANLSRFRWVDTFTFRPRLFCVVPFFRRGRLYYYTSSNRDYPICRQNTKLP